MLPHRALDLSITDNRAYSVDNGTRSLSELELAENGSRSCGLNEVQCWKLRAGKQQGLSAPDILGQRHYALETDRIWQVAIGNRIVANLVMHTIDRYFEAYMFALRGYWTDARQCAAKIDEFRFDCYFPKYTLNVSKARVQVFP